MKIKNAISENLPFWIAVFLSLLRLVHLHETYLLGDETWFLARAHELNDLHEWATQSLTGHATYGPFALWFYQVGWKLGGLDFILVAKVLVFNFAELWLLWEISKNLPRHCKWAGLVLFLSPHFWIASRDCWDNSLIIPLMGLAAASYLSFLRSERALLLLVTFVSLAAGYLTHLLALPLALAIVTDLFWNHRSWVKAKSWKLVAIFTACALIVLPYTLLLLHSFSQIVNINASSDRKNIQFLAGFGNAFLGPRIFEFAGNDYRFGVGWWHSFDPWLNAFLIPAYLFSASLCVFVYRGAYRCYSGRFKNASLLAFARMSCLAFGFHLLVSTLMRLGDFWAYFNGIWPALFLFLLAGISDLEVKNKFRWFFLLEGASLSLCFVSMMVFFHVHAGSKRGAYGPDLAEKIKIAAELGTYKDDVRVRYELPTFEAPLRLLKSLQGKESQKGLADGREIFIHYRNPSSRWDAQLVLDEVQIKAR